MNVLQHTFDDALSKTNTLTFNIPQNATYTPRRRRSASVHCSDSINKWDYKLVFKSISGASLFTVESLKAICALTEKLVQSTSSCPSFSVGNYVAKLNNRSSCRDITAEDVTKTLLLVKNCSSNFTKGLLKNNNSPGKCTDFNAIYNILEYLSDKAFQSQESITKLKYSMAMFPSYHIFAENVYYKSFEGLSDPESYPRDGDVQLAAFSFGNLKNDIFNKKLISDVIYPALSMALVFIIMVTYLQSIILTIHALECIIFALVISYFTYHIVFGIKFFPFLNVTTFVFLVGIGADDAFVYYDIWCQTKQAYPNASAVELTWKTLRYAALSMFVTSLTTASAFYASASSTIIAIKCFGIFAGTSILANYLMMVTYFPAVVLLHERYILKRPAVIPQQNLSEQGEPEAMDMGRSSGDKLHIEPTEKMAFSSSPGIHHAQDDNLEEKVPCILRVFDYPCVFIRPMNAFFRKIASKLFLKWLPNAVIKLRWMWLVVFLALTVGFLCVNFVKPGLKLPVSKDFQVFASSHPLEQYDLNYKSHFRFEQTQSAGNSNGRQIILVWGLKAVDNGNHFDPDDRGTIEFDSSFDMFEPKAQEWLLSLCLSITNKTFYVPRDRDCLMAEFKKVMALPCGFAGLAEPCCNKSAFPYQKNVFGECLIKVLQRQPTGWYNGPVFEPNTGEVKGLVISYQSNAPYTDEYKVTDEFWNKIKSWADDILAKAPPGLQNGWVVSWGMGFYNLQTNIASGTFSSMGISVAIAFLVMLLTTLNIFISLYAIVTIIGIIAITVGSLVLAGWYLNILESIVMSVAVGLSIDFTMHYGVAYRTSPVKDDRDTRVRYSLVHIGSAVTMAAVTTFLTGVYTPNSKKVVF